MTYSFIFAVKQIKFVLMVGYDGGEFYLFLGALTSICFAGLVEPKLPLTVNPKVNKLLR